MKEFKGKVAVITGAASGIGRGIAEHCVQKGMKVVLADISLNVMREESMQRVFTSHQDSKSWIRSTPTDSL